MSNPKVSIIIPVYNTEKYLEKTVNSILLQTFSQIEVLIVDDGSNKECAEICDKIQDRDKRVKVFHQENHGVCYARNVGIKYAQGEYIGFVDSDDLIEPDMYEVLYENAKATGSDISCVSDKIIRLDGSEKANIENDVIETFSREEALSLFFTNRKINMGVYTKIYKRDSIVGLLFDTKLKVHEDKKFIFEALLKSSKVCFQAKNKYIYIKRGDSASNVEFQNKYFDIITVGKYISETTKKELPILCEEAEANCLASYIRMAKIMVMRNAVKTHKKEFDDVLHVIKSYSFTFARDYLYYSDLIRFVICKVKPFFILFVRYIDKD